MSEPTYIIRAANLPDGDGHYQVNIVKNGGGVKVIFRSDRDLAISEARSWVALDQEAEAQSWEEITIAPEPQSLRA
jgi:hypothetical protein